MCLFLESQKDDLNLQSLTVQQDGDPVICGKPLGGPWGLLIALHDHIMAWEDEAISQPSLPMVWTLFPTYSNGVDNSAPTTIAEMKR